MRRELERYRGTVEKFIGDAVVAVFGAPSTHEDDPERAVRAALSVRDAVTEDQLHVRIGVTTGEALVALDARPERGEGMASGDVVNTAARIQAAAPVDGILADEGTWRATERAIEYRDHPPVEARGKSERVLVREAVAVRSRLGLDVPERTATPLVGRQLELDVLTTALSRARGERQPQLVTLVGVPGIGKSRLVLELFRRVEADPELIRWRQGRCLPYGEGVSLWALGEIVKAQAGVLETDSSEQASDKLSVTVRAVIADPDEAGWAERHLRPLVGLDHGTELSGDRRDEAFAAWRRFFEGVAEHGPAVLVLEDLQWADDTLLDFVDHLVEWAADVPMLVVATARPELLARRPGWSGGKANATIESLAPLSDTETAALARAILGRALLPAEVRQSLVENAGGNPLYAEEFARMVAERPDGVTGGALPESVHGVIAARLDSLDPAEKALLQDAAVLGKVFWLSALEAMTGDDRWRLERRLHELERRELVRRDRQSAVAGERQFAFRHLLIREVAYGQIPRGTRADKHAVAARWIEALSPDRSDDRADMLAHHWSAALDYARAAGQEVAHLTSRTRDALVAAGDRALGLNAPGSAATFYERALALARTEDVLLRYGRSLYLTGDQRAEAVLLEVRRLAEQSGDQASEALAEAMLSHIAWLAGDQQESTRRIERAVDLMHFLAASSTKAYVYARAASRAHVANRLDDALTLAQQAFTLADELGIDDLRVHALTTIGDARALMGDPGGTADLQRAVELGLAVRSPEVGRALHNLAIRHFLDGDIAGSRQLLLEVLPIDELLGNEPMARFTRATMVAAGYFVGDWDAAISSADAFILECEASPHYQEAFVRSFRALVRLARDDVAGARGDVERVLGLLDREVDPQARGSSLGPAARVLLELGDPRGERVALEVFSVRIGRAPEPVAPVLLASLDAAAEVEERLAELVRQADTPSPWIEGARAATERRWLDAAEIYASMPFRPAEADARLRATEQLIAEGRRAEADEQLQRALAFWRRVEATRYLRDAERLRATA